MAVKTLYFLSTLGSSPNWFGLMQDGGTAPTAANSTAGWQVGKTAVTTPFYRGRWGASAAATVASTSSYIAGTSGPAKGTGNTASLAGDSFITPTAYSGTFAAGAWTLSVTMRPTTVTLTGRLRMRVWASVNADGTSARELTSGALVGATNSMSTTTDFTAGFSWSPAAITLNNEFLFFQIEWEETTAGSSNSSAAVLRIGAALITTTDFVITVSGTFAPTEVADAAVVSGGVEVAGTLAEIEDPDVSVFPGFVEWRATLAPVEAADVSAFPSIVEWQGQLGVTEGSDVAAIAGTVLAAGIFGTFSLLEVTDALAGVGPITKTFLDPSRVSSHITLSNSNLTATRVS